MQMRRLYETTNKKIRAARMRKDAAECSKAGYDTVAAVNWGEANLLDPPREEDPQDLNNPS